MTRLLMKALPWLLVAALAFVLVSRCGRDATDPIPAPLARQLDSLKSTAAKYRADSARAADSIKVERARGDSAAARARAWQQAANRSGSRADSLARRALNGEATPGSIVDWKPAYVARTAENAELRAVIRSDTVTIAARTREADEATRQKVAAEARVHVLETETVPGLEKAVKTAQKANQCTIALRIPCPPRWVVAVVSLAGGAVIVAAAKP